MNIEFEATFPGVSIPEIQDRLKALKAHLTKPRTFYKRVTFNLPHVDPDEYVWARVRDEGDVITMTIKEWGGKGIEAQKELELIIDDFDTGVAFLTRLGCIEKAYQETYREIWSLGEVHIMIDEWPFLEPFVEIEGPNEASVKEVSQKLGFDYKDAIFAGVTVQYEEKYGISNEVINNAMPRITFDKNPFTNK